MSNNDPYLGLPHFCDQTRGGYNVLGIERELDIADFHSRKEFENSYLFLETTESKAILLDRKAH